jgi:hypothetical protein
MNRDFAKASMFKEKKDALDPRFDPVASRASFKAAEPFPSDATCEAPLQL